VVLVAVRHLAAVVKNEAGLLGGVGDNFGIV